ncbi:hypothetical protein PENSPDRAFT_687223 [Peniophora sp. CONT]|nr:hypothetical protein PENSPDRAFT_687223 [Peniophora sp. CONT]
MLLRRRTDRPSPHRSFMTAEGSVLVPRQSSSAPLEGDDIWNYALNEYRACLDIDLRDNASSLARDLELCSNTDEILDVLQDASECLSDRRQGSKASRVLRGALRPVVDGLSAILNTSAETASGIGVPGGKGIFTAIAVLLKAADGVSATYDDLKELFGRLTVYIERLQQRIKAPMAGGTRKIVIKTLVEVLRALETATRMIRKGRIEIFLNTLFTKSKDVQSAIQNLETIMMDEERMAITDVVVGMHELSSDVLGIRTSLTTLATGNEELQQVVQRTDLTTQNILARLEAQREIRRRRSIDEAMYGMLQELINRSAPGVLEDTTEVSKAKETPSDVDVQAGTTVASSPKDRIHLHTPCNHPMQSPEEQSQPATVDLSPAAPTNNPPAYSLPAAARVPELSLAPFQRNNNKRIVPHDTSGVDWFSEDDSDRHSTRNAVRSTQDLPKDFIPGLYKALSAIDRPTTRDLGWIRLTHVDRTWRSAGMAMPSLWARDYGTMASHDAADTFRARACGTPLTVSISGRLSKRHEDVLIHVVSASICSIKTLSLVSHSYPWSSLVAGKRLPELCELDLDDGERDGRFNGFKFEPTLYAPKLTHASLRGTRAFLLVAPSLISLTLTNVLASSCGIFDILRGTPSLEHLVLDMSQHQDSIVFKSYGRHIPVELPHLLTFRIL